MAPRWAISNFSTLPEHARPQKALGENHNSIMAWLEWIFVPEYYIYLNRENILGGLPGFLPYVLLAQLFVKMVTILIVIYFSGSPKMALLAVSMIIGWELVRNSIATACAFIYSGIFWPFIPWFLTDLFFYGAMYVFPIIQLYEALKPKAEKMKVY
jgi:hypothetical protein